jgi:hypothetical protein
MGDDQPKSVGALFAEAMPQVLSIALVAIGGLLFSMQVSFTRVDANVQQLVKSIEELKTDTKTQMTDLENRVRALEMHKQ